MQTFSQRAQSLKNRTQTHKKRLIFFPPHATPPLPQCGTASSVSRRSTVAPQNHTAQEPPPRGQSPKAHKAQPIDALIVDNRSITVQQNHTFCPAKPYLLPCETLPFAKPKHTFRQARGYSTRGERCPAPPCRPTFRAQKIRPANARRHKTFGKIMPASSASTHPAGNQNALATTKDATQGHFICVFSILKRGRCLLSMYILPMYSPMMPRLTSTHPKPNHTESITDAQPATTLSVTYSHST